jgi:DNA-directed RNA polymerase sigma subunit (sigma70/sigma32)
MVFISVEDFFEKAANCTAVSRQEEIALAQRMQAGDQEARQKLIEGYLPFVAGYLRRQKDMYQTLTLALYFTKALESAVDAFNFLQDSETFLHRLSWYLRQAFTKYLVR